MTTSSNAPRRATARTGSTPRRWADPRRPLPRRVRHRARRHDRQRRPARRSSPSSAPRPASCSGSSTPTSSCSPACCSRPAASATGSAASARCMVGLVVFGVDVGARRARPASPATLIAGAGAHGRRRRADLPGDAGDPHQHLPRSRRARQGDRRLERGQRRRGRRRPDHRRLAARALLVGLGVLRQRAGRDRRRASPRSCSCPSRGTRDAPALDWRRPRCCRSPRSARSCSRSSRRPSGAGSAPTTLVGFAVAAALLAAFVVVGAAGRRTRCCRCAIFRNLRFSARRASSITVGVLRAVRLHLPDHPVLPARSAATAPLEAGVRTLPVAFSIAVASVAGARARAPASARRGSSPPGWC